MYGLPYAKHWISPSTRFMCWRHSESGAKTFRTRKEHGKICSSVNVIFMSPVWWYGGKRSNIFWNRLLFWSDWDDVHPRIERAMMDGSNRTQIKTSDLKYPNGLTIDFTTQRLYWCDAKTDVIGSMYFDGTGQQVHLLFSSMHTFGLSLYNGTFFWSDWNTKSIFKGSTNGSFQELLKPRKDNVYDVRVFSKENQPGNKWFRWSWVKWTIEQLWQKWLNTSFSSKKQNQTTTTNIKLQPTFSKL